MSKKGIYRFIVLEHLKPLFLYNVNFKLNLLGGDGFIGTPLELEQLIFINPVSIQS